MTGFQRPERVRLDDLLVPVGRGWIHASLFDLGIYPGAVPAADSRVWGEVHRMLDADTVLSSLDEFEGYRGSEPSTNLYIRVPTAVTLDDGQVTDAWVYFYNAPLGGPSASSPAITSST